MNSTVKKHVVPSYKYYCIAFLVTPKHIMSLSYYGEKHVILQLLKVLTFRILIFIIVSFDFFFQYYNRTITFNS